MTRYASVGSGEWPTGIHWTPGEQRDVPDDYPRTEPAPSWLVMVEVDPEPTTGAAAIGG